MQFRGSSGSGASEPGRGGFPRAGERSAGAPAAEQAQPAGQDAGL